MVGLGRFELPTSPLSGVRSNQLSYRPEPAKTGGAGRDRTGDLLNANQALSQLSYSPRLSNLIEADWMQGDQGIKPIATLILLLNFEPRVRNEIPFLSALFSLCLRRSLGTVGFGMDRNGYRVYTQHDSCHGLFRKEVIQPQVLLRLPCYDFTPIMSHTLGRCPPCGSACGLLVQPTFVM